MQAERAWLQWIRHLAAAGPQARGLRLGIGDDAALLAPRPGWELALTTDLMVEGVHFRRDRDSAGVVGRRLATRALSDLAAMGAEPLALLVSCAFPSGLATAWSRGLMRGIVNSAAEAGATLAGGDLAAARSADIVLDVIGAGQAPRGRALRRDGARAGDLVCVSGPLGFAALGRQLAHGGQTPRTREERTALARHRHPSARWELGAALRGVASAVIDLSDGLSTDLDHLCRASGVRAEIETEAIPRPQGREGLALALNGGEDYELLFTVPPRQLKRLPDGVTRIGRVLPGRGARIGAWIIDDRGGDRGRRRLLPGGWEHFR